MFLSRFALIGAAFLLAASAGGCGQSPTEKVEEAQEDVVEAKQELREKEADLNHAERDAQADDKGGPILTPPATSDAPPQGQEPDTPATDSAPPS